MRALITLICCRGLAGLSPVAGSKLERTKDIVRSPVPAGSKNRSLRGIAIARGWPDSSGVKSMSWPRN